MSPLSLREHQNVLDHEGRGVEGGINYARQAFDILNTHAEFPGKFTVERPGKDEINLVHKKVLWITPNVESEFFCK